MGCVSSEETCPNCKGTANVDFHYRTNAYSLFCETCGYRENGDEHGAEKHHGHGAYKVRYERFSQIGSFRRRKPAHKRFLPAFIAKQRVLAVTVTERVRGKWRTVTLKHDATKSIRDWKDRMLRRNRPKKCFSTALDDIEF